MVELRDLTATLGTLRSCANHTTPEETTTMVMMAQNAKFVSMYEVVGWTREWSVDVTSAQVSFAFPSQSRGENCITILGCTTYTYTYTYCPHAIPPALDLRVS